ncbi:tRNA 2-selenouridine(34) synthase MnmH [Phenylobacterium sp. LjRoot219]|uniref:tRNA 2-selenouridine(34) synthase MnmH n=1 Tax=Phenylobacterium sp. LjRoot219 TaxID=3342283 RepID=UPI003ED0EE8A
MTSPEVVRSPDAATRAQFDLVIDVRSPGEFALDHVPGAVNLPVLDDAERAEIGTIYAQESRFKARRVGAAYVARNVARHLETALADKTGGFRPLLYCWRGGMRSNAMALILSQVGWRTAVLAGGYRTYRREVTARLYEDAPGIQAVVLDGPTGSGKTAVLHRLAQRGVQVLDLEALAEHRGSLLGALPGRAQPSQRMFESRLLAALEAMDPARPVVIEAESSKVGQRIIPPTVWQAMAAAPQIVLAAPAPARARYLAAAYGGLAADPERLIALLQRLPSHPGPRQLESWQSQLAAGALEALAADLIAQHYDPAYRRSSRKQARAPLGEVAIDAVTPNDLDQAAEAVARLLARLAPPPQ